MFFFIGLFFGLQRPNIRDVVQGIAVFDVGVTTLAWARVISSFKESVYRLGLHCLLWSGSLFLPHMILLNDFRNPPVLHIISTNPWLLPEVAVNSVSSITLNHQFMGSFLRFIIPWICRYRCSIHLLASAEMEICSIGLNDSCQIYCPIDIGSGIAREICCQLHHILQLIPLLICIAICRSSKLVWYASKTWESNVQMATAQGDQDSVKLAIRENKFMFRCRFLLLEDRREVLWFEP